MEGNPYILMWEQDMAQVHEKEWIIQGLANGVFKIK